MFWMSCNFLDLFRLFALFPVSLLHQTMAHPGTLYQSLSEQGFLKKGLTVIKKFCFTLTLPFIGRLLNMAIHYYHKSCRVFKEQVKPSNFSLQRLVFMILSLTVA